MRVFRRRYVSHRIPVTYVASSSHSGSTLLALLADQHPRLATVGETAIKPRIRREGRSSAQRCSCGQCVGDCPFWQSVFRHTSADVRFDLEHWSNDYRFERAWLDALLTRETSSVAVRRIRHWAMRHLPLLRDRTARVDRANVAFVKAVLARKGAATFLDTTKLVTRLAYLLDVREFRVNVIHLVRDVRGFAASAKRRGEPPSGAARVWRQDQLAIERVLSASPSTPTLRIRYEDLCANPGDTLRRLWEFCEIEPVAASTIVRAGEHHVIGNNMRMGDVVEVRFDDAWERSLASDEQSAVLNVAGDLHQRLGYA